MTLYYPHIQKSLDTITHICAVLSHSAMCALCEQIGAQWSAPPPGAQHRGWPTRISTLCPHGNIVSGFEEGV